MKKSLIDFLVLGGQKCGTTMLHHWLKQNSHINMPKLKETHFFNYYFSNTNKMYESLRKSVVAGALQTAGYLNNKKKYVQKINRLSKKINIKVSNYNG